MDYDEWCDATVTEADDGVGVVDCVSIYPGDSDENDDVD